MITKLIAITGEKYHGKNTVADMISEIVTANGESCGQFSFAKALKIKCAEMLGISLEEIDSAHKEIYRPFLQWYGTDYIRVHRGMPKFWINKLEREISEKKFDISIITDLRTEDERWFVKKHNGLIFKVYNNRTPKNENSSHVSETGVAEIQEDYFIENDGDLSLLKARVKTACSALEIS